MYRSEVRKISEAKDDIHRTGRLVRRVFEELLPGWHGEDDGPVCCAVEAQIASAALGLKPLYFDPWGGFAPRLIEPLLQILPQGTEVRSAKENLFVYQNSRVRRVVQRDFFLWASTRSVTAGLWEMIQHVSSTGDNGILLGYGAPFFDPTMPRVIVFSESNPRRIYASFSTSLDRRVAARCAEARLGENASCTDDTLAYVITD